MERPEHLLLGESGYELQEEIGRGASGVVYRARQVSLDRVVALKRITSESGSEPVTTHRIEVEVAALVRLEHALVVRVYDVVVLPGEVWIVMEHVDGPTLSSVLERRERPLDPPDALAVIESLASGLSQVAGAGIVHRDLKPANVFVTYAGRVKIGDFGVAWLRAKVGPAAAGGTSDDAARWTRPGTILGTPAYLAPEQAAGRPDVDSRADLYSLGVIAFELLSGRVPFLDQGNLFALLAAHQSAEIPRLRDFRQDLPAEIEPVVRKALGKRAGDRQVSAEAFWVELDRAAASAWPSWRVTSDLAGLAAGSGRLPRSGAGTSLPRQSGLAPSEATVSRQPGAGSTLVEPPCSVEPKSNAAVSVGGEVPPSHRRPSRDGRRSRGAHSVRAGLLAAVLAAAAVAGYVLIGVLLEAPTSGLSVGTISLGVAGSCSAGTAQATAALRTNGAAGVVVFRWGETGRSVGPLGRTSVPSGDRYVHLRFNLGHARRTEPPVASSVTFQVLSPGPARAATLSIRAGC
ncbi:MAG: serine/threonine-protein kinase [Acidimicrobiales bacterium]